MKLLANENFPKASVDLLRTLGYDVVAIFEDNRGIADSTIMDIAQNEERLILTFDRDYGELIYKYGYKPPQGVLYLRLQQFTPDEPGKIVHNLLAILKIETDSKLTVCTGDSVRQRSY